MRCFSTLHTATSRMALISVVLLVGACDRFNIAAFQPDLNTYGAEPILDPQSFQQVDLAKLLTADSPALKWVGTNDPKKAEKEVWNQDVLKRAFDEFAARGDRAKRTRIQERIVAASDQRCEAYFRYLKRFDVQTNVLFNSVTTLLGGLGAIFTGADTVRALSGSAAIVSGWGAVSNDAFFQDLTVQVVTNGIKLQRNDVHNDMALKRNLPLAAYPAEAAVRDAIRYHAGCSLVAGLERAALELDRVDDPGVRQMQRTLFEVKRLQRIQDLTPEEALSKDVQQDLARTFPGVSPESVAGPVEEVPSDVWFNVQQRVHSAAIDVEKALVNRLIEIEALEIEEKDKKPLKDQVEAIRKLLGKDADKPAERTGSRKIIGDLLDALNQGDRQETLTNDIKKQAAKVGLSAGDAYKIEAVKLETLRSNAEHNFNEPLRKMAGAYEEVLIGARVKLNDENFKGTEDDLAEAKVKTSLCKIYEIATLGKTGAGPLPAFCKAAKAAKPAAPAAPAAGAKNTEPDKDAKRLTPPFVRLGSFDPAAIGDEAKAMTGAVERREQARAIKGLIPDGVTIQAWKPEKIWVVDLGSFKSEKDAKDFCENPLLGQMKDGFKKANDCGVKIKTK